MIGLRVDTKMVAISKALGRHYQVDLLRVSTDVTMGVPAPAAYHEFTALKWRNAINLVKGNTTSVNNESLF